MAGGGGGGSRSLEQTPTWAVAAVCFVLVVISIFIEHVLHLIGKWLKKRHKLALHESLEKIKSELMMMGFISLLLTVGQGPISNICIPKSVANTWHPCENSNGHKNTSDQNSRDDDDNDASVGRRLLWSSTRRILAGGSGGDKCEAKGKASFVSSDGIHQLHIFIFVLAVFHVLYCITTMALGRAKVESTEHTQEQIHMRKWKSWEKETKTMEYQFTYDPERFRFARDTSFGRRHLNYWTKSPILIWIACFFRQFVRSVAKIDYLTLRHGFIMAHLAPQSSTKFDFQKYIKRSLDEDFKVVVGISPTTWFFAILFLLSNAHGWYSYLWLPFIPLIIILLVGAKLQVIITQMGLDIQNKGDVVKGIPVVQPADHHFWFNRPTLILYLIHFVLFQNAFQLAFFVWAWYEFGLRSCYHQKLEDMIIRLSMGVLTQFICSYVTLPLYALVTQMGSNLKPTIFNDRVAAALRKWHHTARKHIKQIQRSESVTPFSPSTAATPVHGHSPVHLLRHNSSPSPRFFHSENERWNHEGSVSPSDLQRIMEDSLPHNNGNHEPSEDREMEDMTTQPLEEAAPEQCDIDMSSKAFSFAKR